MRDAAKKPVKPIIIYTNSESHQPTNDKSLAFSYDGEKYVLRIEKLIEEI